MASNSFYNQSRQERRANEKNDIISSFVRRKRRPLGDVDDSWAKKRPDKHRLSLTKMAHATRTFWTQAEALEFIAQRQKNNHSVTRSMMFGRVWTFLICLGGRNPLFIQF